MHIKQLKEYELGKITSWASDQYIGHVVYRIGYDLYGIGSGPWHSWDWTALNNDCLFFEPATLKDILKYISNANYNQRFTKMDMSVQDLPENTLAVITEWGGYPYIGRIVFRIGDKLYRLHSKRAWHNWDIIELNGGCNKVRLATKKDIMNYFRKIKLI